MSKSLGRFVAAAAIYACFAFYLFRPHFQNFSRLADFTAINICIGAAGCFVLSRRWVSSSLGSLFAGVIYGFGPYLLDLGKFHPTIGFLVAAIPWLFCPAAYGPSGKQQWLRVPLCAVPFLAILLFFQFANFLHLFPIPISLKMHPIDLINILSPIFVLDHSMTGVGFYHIPLAGLVMGVSMLIAARRFGAMLIFAAGAVLAFCNPILNISPIVWLSFPVLVCCIVIGVGMQGLTAAGTADKGWILVISIILTVLFIAAFLLSKKYYELFGGAAVPFAGIFAKSARMYLVGAAGTFVLFLIAQLKLRLAWLRWIILSAAMGADIFIGARFIVDKIF
jgi:hypothetical protein